MWYSNMVLVTMGVVWPKWKIWVFQQATVSFHDGFSPNAIQILKELETTIPEIPNLSTQIHYQGSAGGRFLGVKFVIPRLPVVRLQQNLVPRASIFNCASPKTQKQDSNPRLNKVWLKIWFFTMTAATLKNNFGFRQEPLGYSYP